MITVTPKYPDIHPAAYQAVPFSPEHPWTHLQILGGRQVVVFDKAGDVMLTFDLALTADVKIIRAENIVSASFDDNGVDVHVVARQAVQLGPSTQKLSALKCCTDTKLDCQQPEDCQAFNGVSACDGDKDEDEDEDY